MCLYMCLYMCVCVYLDAALRVEAEEGVGVGEELEARVGGDAGHAEAVVGHVALAQVVGHLDGLAVDGRGRAQHQLVAAVVAVAGGRGRGRGGGGVALSVFFFFLC